MGKLTPVLTFFLGILAGGGVVFAVLRSAPSAPRLSGGAGAAAPASEIAEDWMYMGKRTHGLTVSPKNSDRICATVRSQNKGKFEEAWNFYARKCDPSLSYSAGDRRLIAEDGDGVRYAIFNGDGSDGVRAASFSRADKDHTVSAFLAESKPDQLTISVTVSR